MALRRCPIHGTVVCPLSEDVPLHDVCRECRLAIQRIRAGKPKYEADRELEQRLLDRALRGVRKSVRHVLSYG